MVVPPELEAEDLVEDDVVLVGPLSLAGRRLAPKELESSTWVSREEGSATRAAVEAARWQIGLHAVRELHLPSWEAVKLAVARGAGVAAISRFALTVELMAGTLAVLEVPRWKLSRTVALVTARDVPLTPPAERFRALLRTEFASRAPSAARRSRAPAASRSSSSRGRRARR
jgi:DNA-binding transcriptional LysR family regulator